MSDKLLIELYRAETNPTLKYNFKIILSEMLEQKCSTCGEMKKLTRFINEFNGFTDKCYQCRKDEYKETLDDYLEKL